MKTLVFPSLEIAELDEGQICVNILRRDWDTIKLVDKNGNDIVTFEQFLSLSNEDKRLCKQLGKNAKTGEWVRDAGFTSRWAIPQQINNDTRYWIPHPGDDLMSYLDGYEILDYQNTWEGEV